MERSHILTTPRDNRFYQTQQCYVQAFQRALRAERILVLAGPLQRQKGFQLTVSTEDKDSERLDQALKRLQRSGYQFHVLDRTEVTLSCAASDSRKLILLYMEESFPRGCVTGFLLKLCVLGFLWTILHTIHPQLYYLHD